jgi:hypothetical protein
MSHVRSTGWHPVRLHLPLDAVVGRLGVVLLLSHGDVAARVGEGGSGGVGGVGDGRDDAGCLLKVGCVRDTMPRTAVQKSSRRLPGYCVCRRHATSLLAKAAAQMRKRRLLKRRPPKRCA